MALKELKKYRSEPLKCWRKAKELRLNHYKKLHSARELGLLTVTGGVEGFTPLVAGLGDFAFLGAEPWGASIATDPVLSTQCAEAIEARNYARDLCSYMRNYWGSMILDKSPFGGHFPKPDFCFQTHFCDSHAKWFQVVSEHFKVPYKGIDLPVGPNQPGHNRLRVKYLEDQLHEAIEWMEKITGKEYNDELLVQAANNEARACSLWAEICTYQKYVPAPLDQKSIFALYVMAVLMRHEKQSGDFYEELLDEVKYRAANQIAALPTERCRLFDDSQPPWYFLELYRHVERYGAVFVGSVYTYGLMGAWDDLPDGSMVALKTPQQLGQSLKDREEAVHHLAELTLRRMTWPSTFYGPIELRLTQERMAKQWKLDGYVYHLNRGCEGSVMGQMENKLHLSKLGIPTLTFEGNMGDKRELNEAQVLDRLDAFMESMGLEKLAT